MLCLADKLRTLRKDKRLKQRQVAETIGVSPSVVSAYEAGLRQPSYDVLLKLANLYHVSLDYLFGRENGIKLDVSQLTEGQVALLSSLIAELGRR